MSRFEPAELTKTGRSACKPSQLRPEGQLYPGLQPLGFEQAAEPNVGLMADTVSTPAGDD